MKKAIVVLICVALMLVSLTGCGPLASTKKPVIYLYPTQKTNVTVKLSYHGDLTCTYPTYNGEWNVTAYPDVHLINNADQKEYSYLY